MFSTKNTDGIVSSSYFGQAFEEEKFFLYTHQLFQLKNILTKVTKEHALRLEVDMDLKEINGGSEVVCIQTTKGSINDNYHGFNFCEQYLPQETYSNTGRLLTTYDFSVESLKNHTDVLGKPSFEDLFINLIFY